MLDAFGDETIVLVEIDQPFCTKTWGATCSAALGADGTDKCYNTLKTCPARVQPEFNAGTLTLRFCRPQDRIRDYGFVIPSIVSGPSTTPGTINLAGMDERQSGLGQRESVQIHFADHLYSDLLVDPYRLERESGAANSTGQTFIPYEQGTFWAKFIARNPYYTTYRARIYEGAVGQTLDEMNVRHYLVSSITPPSVDGVVSIELKDFFSVIEEQKAVFPVASRGELQANITSGAGSGVLVPTGIGDAEYPASGYVAIGDECIAFTRSGDTLTFTQRGALDTDADAHDAEDTVQLVGVLDADQAHEHVYTLLTQYSGADASMIDKTAWDTAAAVLTSLYSAKVAKPTPVEDLIGELSIQAGFTVFPNVATGLIDFVPLTATAPTVTVTDRNHIVASSLQLKREDDRRVSQVEVWYGQKSPTKDVNDTTNYHSRVVADDPAAEENYGLAIRTICSRWIPQFGRSIATDCAERILIMFVDPPTSAVFRERSSERGSIGVAHPFTLDVPQFQDSLGVRAPQTQTVTAIERGEAEDEYSSLQTVLAAPSGDREIFIDDDTGDINLRTLHDSLFVAPTGGETVDFTIGAAAFVGSSSTAHAGIIVGTWPAGVTLTLIIVGESHGCGGAPGKGGDAFASGPFHGHAVVAVATDGQAGGDGGPAIDARSYPIRIQNNGAIRGGAGGNGGGGGFAWVQDDLYGIAAAGNGAGAPTAYLGRAGANAGFPDADHLAVLGVAGGASTLRSGGAGGETAFTEVAGGVKFKAGGAANGQSAGTAGITGNPAGFQGANPGSTQQLGNGGPGGAVGPAVLGGDNVTWLAMGTIQGAIIP